MKVSPLFRCAIVALTSAAITHATPARAQTVTDAQRAEFEKIIKDYLFKHPEVIEEAIGEFEKRRVAADVEKRSAVIKANADVLLKSPHQAVLGNPQGDVTVVEFFDYNCSYCRRALPDVLALVKSDPKLRIVLKEFPVLGSGSVEAATVAIAVRMQDREGTRYQDFHQRLLTHRGPANKATALALARELGLDLARLEKDMASSEVAATIDESAELAHKIGLQGTPSFVIGGDVVTGAISKAQLSEKVRAARR